MAMNKLNSTSMSKFFNALGEMTVRLLEFKCRFNRKISGINIDEETRNFPIYISSEHDYELLNNRIKDFISEIDNNKNLSIILSSNNINLLMNKGKTHDRDSKSNIPNFYEIKNGKILEHKFIYPASFSKYGFIKSVWATWFESDDVKILQKWEPISSTDRPAVGFVQPASIDKSDLLYRILFPVFTSANLEHFKEITSKIRSIHIDDKYLYLEI
jgi:hypothetical protein